jgi:hypothetical protein
MANNQNRENKPAMTDQQIEDEVRMFLNLYTKQAQTNENRKQLVSNYRNTLRNQNMRKVNRILAARIGQAKKDSNIEPEAMAIYMNPTSTNQISFNGNDKDSYSMIIRTTPGGKFFFAKSLIRQRNYKFTRMLRDLGGAAANAIAIRTPAHQDKLKTDVRNTMKYLVNLVTTLQSTQITDGSLGQNFNELCDAVAEQIQGYVDEKLNSIPRQVPPTVYEVKLKSTRTNNPVQTARYLQEVFKLVHTHGGKVIGGDGASKCPILPILLNTEFQNGASGKNNRVWAAFSYLRIGGTGFDKILVHMTDAYNNPTRTEHPTYTAPLSKLMNDHYMNLWSLEASLGSLAVLVSVTPDSVSAHFGMNVAELVNNNRALAYSSVGSEIMVLSNAFLGTATQGVFINVANLFQPFVAVAPTQNNIIRESKRAIKKSSQSQSSTNLRPELRKIDPLLQRLNRLRFGKTTSNNRINANNNNIRMNYNSNTAPARLFVDMVFREILNYKTGRQFDRNKFSMDLRTIYSTFTSSGVDTKKLKTKINRTYNLNADSNATRAMRNDSTNNQTMRNVNMTKIKQLIVEMRDDFNNLFKINQNGVHLSIRSAISGKFALGNSNSNGQNEWDYVSWFLSNVELANGSSNPAISKLRNTHELVVSAVFALIKKYHAQFTRALLKPITGNSNNVSTRLHNLNADQKREAVSMCYSVAHAELFARVGGQRGHRTYGDEGDVDGNTRLTFANGDLPGYSIPAGLMFDCRLPVYDGKPNGVHAATPDEDTVRSAGPGGNAKRSKDGLPGLMGNTPGNPGENSDDHYCNKVNNPAGGTAYVDTPIGDGANLFGNYALLTNAKHGKTIADIKRDGVIGLSDYPEIPKLSMNPDHMIGYKDVPARGADNAAMMNNIMRHTYNKRRDVVVQEFMSSKKTSSGAAYLWYDCGDTHAMRVAAEVTSKLVSDLKQLGFANYPISGYVAATSPLFEQSVILRQTGMLCAPIFLETLRRRLGNAPLNQTEYVSYGAAPIKTSSRLKRSLNYVSASLVSLLKNASPVKVILAEEVLFSPKSIHDMGGIEYHKSTPSFIDSISNRPNNIPNAKSINKRLPAYQNKHRFYLVNGLGTLPYTGNQVKTLNSVDSLKRLMNFDYWQLRRSFWVSHLINLGIIYDTERINDETQMKWDVSKLETPEAKESLSLLERVLAYWQMYNHADRKIGANHTTLRTQIEAGILDTNETSTRFHRGMYGSKGNELNARLNMEYSMAVEKSKQMRQSLMSKFS